MKPTQWPEIRILLRSDCPLGRKVVCHSCCWSEVEVLQTGIITIENRIDDDVQRMQVQSEDRPDFGREARRVPISKGSLIALTPWHLVWNTCPTPKLTG